MELGHNPIQCDCGLMNFIPFIMGKVIRRFQTYLKFLIDDLFCDGPYWIANASVKDIDSKNIKCDWVRTNNTDACT